MSRCVQSSISRWNIFWLAIGLGGCAIADSTIVDLRIPYAPGTVVCSSSLGSYALPKSFIRVVLGQPKGGRPDFVVDGKDVPEHFKLDVVRRADPALTVCLDYLASAFAHDRLTVIKQEVNADGSLKDAGTDATTSRQFLRSIIVSATDRSVQIARNLIRAAFIGLSGDPSFGPERAGVIAADTDPEILADLEFDPFDTRDAAEANERLARFGFCLVLEGFTFDRNSLTVDQYCGAPLKARDHPPRVAELYIQKSREPIPPNVEGVLYRPLQSYMVSVYRKDDPRGRGRWNLSRRFDVALENMSPVISVGISRAIFARRNAYLSFEEGTLRSVCIAKSSEIENFVAIPFEIARSIVALPAQIVQVKVNRFAKEDELARVENLLIQAQAQMLKTQLTQKPQTGPKGDSSEAKQPTKVSALFKKGAFTGLDPAANKFTLTGEAQQRQQDVINRLCDNSPLIVDLPAEESQ